MSGRVFLDTNILVYADDADSGPKQRVARAHIEAALRSGEGVISTQVLQEYFSVATRKLHIDKEAAQRKVELLAHLPLVTIDALHIVEAIKLHRLYSLSFWDALIVQAARLARCNTLLSEDVHSHQRIEGVAVVNPFAA